MITQRELNIICGKSLIGQATPVELASVFHYIAELEGLLDETDGDDYFGTEGWRHHIGNE